MSAINKETVRYFREETELILDYSGGDPGGAWANLTTGIFSRLKTSLLVFAAGFTVNAAGIGGTRIKLTVSGTDYYIGGRLVDGSVSGAAAYVYYGICYLPGVPDQTTGIAVTIAYQGRECTAEVDAAWCKVGVTNFSDLSGDTLDRLVNETIAAAATTTVVDQDIVGELRNCSIGTIRKHVVRLQVMVISTAAQKGVFVDSGTAGADFSIQIFEDDVQQSWESSDEATNDDLTTACSGAAYGEYVFEHQIDDSVNLKVKVTNNDAGGHDYDTFWSIAACPFFAHTEDSEVAMIEIPTGSTVNAIIEPLDNENQSKEIGLGTYKVLGRDKYYGSATGAEDVLYNDQLTDLPQGGLFLFKKGWRTAVSMITGDRRG